MVDDERDPDLGRLFDLRRDLDDETFSARWGIDVPAHIRVLASPSAPEAICAYTIEIARPVALRRTFILLVAKQARLLAWLQQPGTGVWLTPKALGMEAWALEGLKLSDDFYSKSLPLGTVQAPSRGLELALRHVALGGT